MIIMIICLITILVISMKVLGLFSKCCIIALAYCFEIKNMVHVVFLLILFDLITGVWKSIKKSGFGCITSRGLKRTVIKILIYLIAIISIFIVEKEVIMTGIYLTRFVVGMIALVELASIFENMALITGNNVFRVIFDVIKTRLNVDKNIINKIDKGSNKKWRNK